MDLALNNLQRLICHKTNQTKPKCLHYLKHLVFLGILFLLYLNVQSVYDVFPKCYIQACGYKKNKTVKI